MLVIKDENQIDWLIKAICLLKFGTPQDDPDVAEIIGSPIIAETVNMAFDALIMTLQSKGQGGIAYRKEQSRSVENNLIVLEAAKIHVKNIKSQWNAWTGKGKKDYLHTVLSPYTVSEDFLGTFILECDAVCYGA